MELPFERPTVQKGEKMRGTASIKLAYTAIVGLTPESLTWVLCRLTPSKRGEPQALWKLGKRREKKKRGIEPDTPQG